MPWDIKVLRTSAEQSLGVRQFPFPLPVNYLLFFPGVMPGSRVNMVGVKEPLKIFLLDASLEVVVGGLLDPGHGTVLMPQNAEHLVEISWLASPPADFGFLAQYL
jgi:hypothetical protein